MANSDVSQTPFIKNLGSSDRPTREAALASLRTFLSGRRALDSLACLKLWKGLFYCLWMTDRPLPQQALCNNLASLVHDIFPDNRNEFIRAFWATMSREWGNIDVLRMEKFLLCTRRFLGAQLGVCKEAKWKKSTVEEQLSLLEEVPMNVEDMKIGNGIRYHVIDIYIDELERAGALEEGRKGVELSVLLEPLEKLKKSSPTKSVRLKAKEALADERLPGNEKEEDVEMEDEGWGGFDD